MGDPRTSRKKYETPTHPWQGPRISDEAELVQKYGLKNKREVWKAETFLRDVREQARHLQAMEGRDNPQAEKEREQLLDRLHDLGILETDANLADVLALNTEAILTRRLQTQVYLNGLASTPEQGRQLIVHGHIAVDGARVTVPSYKVKREEEPTIDYAPGSPYRDPDHPDRPRVDLTSTGPAADVEEDVDDEGEVPGEDAGPDTTEPEPEAEPDEDAEPAAEEEPEPEADDETEPEDEDSEADETEEGGN
jgi:small subunit ribosomal protein S4